MARQNTPLEDQFKVPITIEITPLGPERGIMVKTPISEDRFTPRKDGQWDAIGTLVGKKNERVLSEKKMREAMDIILRNMSEEERVELNKKLAMLWTS